MNWCDKNRQKLKRQLLQTINDTKQIESQFFGARKPKGCPYYRTGYYLGVDFIEELLRGMPLKEVVLLKGDNLKKLVKYYLTQTKRN